MFLKRLEIQGFKSFAKNTVLTFEPGITAIVGPNGSGKSNIADAVRWVLGEQSKALLRGKKAEDVIFVGSSSKSRAAQAYVSVVFDNQDKKIPIDSAEVVFTRRIDRNGNSEYLINNETCRLLDIIESLNKAGFIQSRHTVIGQGTIDQLLLQGPAEIKSLIEEGAGLALFYDKRAKTLRRLESTRENLEQVRALIAEIEPRLRSLRRQAKKLEQRAQIENQWRELLSGRLSFIFENLDNEKIKLETNIKNLQEQISVIENEVKSLLNVVEDENKNSSVRSKRLSDLQRELTEAQQKKEKLNIALIESKAKENFYSQGNKADARVLKSKILELEKEHRELSNQVKELEEGLEQTQKDINEIISILNTAKPDLVPRFNFIADKFLNNQKNFLNRVRSQRSEVEYELNKLKSDLNASELPEAQKSEVRLENLQKLEKEIELQVNGIKALEEELQKELEGISADSSERQRADQQIRKKEKELHNLRDQQNSLKIELARVETRLEEESRRATAELGSNFRDIISQTTPVDNPESDQQIERLKKQLEMIGGLDDITLQEYEETEDRYAYLTSQVTDLDKAAKDLTEVLNELDEIIKQKFDEAFEITNSKFQEYFRLLFNGGKAGLYKIKSQSETKSRAKGETGEEQDQEETIEEEFAVETDKIEGIEVRATPPGKKLSSLSALSGGERSLTSIALLMAILDANPSPFVVLDEVDAALDESNSIRFAKILGHLADQTQFITITHNRETMRNAHTLYGVTMGEDGVSQILSIKFDQSIQYAKE